MHSCVSFVWRLAVIGQPNAQLAGPDVQVALWERDLYPPRPQLVLDRPENTRIGAARRCLQWRRLNMLRLGLFWHFLGIVRVAIFTVVYLQCLIR